MRPSSMGRAGARVMTPSGDRPTSGGGYQFGLDTNVQKIREKEGKAQFNSELARQIAEKEQRKKEEEQKEAE